MSVICRFLIVATLLHSGLSLGADLDVKLSSILPTESEKSSGSSVITPHIEVEGKKLRKCYVRIIPTGGVYIAYPDSDTTATIKLVFFDVATGGLYVEDPNHPSAVKAGTTTRFLSLKVDEGAAKATEAKIEKDFLRQFAYVLRQRASDAPGTEKFFKHYFEVENGDMDLADEEEPEVADLPARASVVPLAGDPLLIPLRGKAKRLHLKKLFSFMDRPSAWEAKQCTATACQYHHPKLGPILLVRPGAGDLIIKPTELMDASVAATVQESADITSKDDLVKRMQALPADVSKVYVLVSHRDCGPCITLKQSGGAWAKFTASLQTEPAGKAAFVENANTFDFGPSALVSAYGLASSYPQLLVFERSADGNAWKEPRKYSGSGVASELSAQ